LSIQQNKVNGLMALDLRTGESVWALDSRRNEKHPRLDRNIRTEILVVGGGISGSLIAHRLASLGMEVTIVDRRDVGKGSTMASTAMLSYEADVNLGELIQRRGERSAVRAYRLGIEAIRSIENTAKTLDDSCNFRSRRSLYLASSIEDVPMLRREFRTRKRYGFDVSFLDRKELFRTFGLKAPCAILNEQAAEVDPVKLTMALIRSAESNGLRVFARTVGESYQHHPGGAIVTTETGFKIQARHVIFATGYETQLLLRQKDVQLVSSFAIASQPNVKFAAGQERPVIWESARPYLYVRTTDDFRIVAGGEDVDFVDEARRDRLLPEKTKILKAKLRKMFPDVEWTLAVAWTGTFGQSRDGLPYIGPHKNYPGAQFALGYGGNGITFSSIASSIIPDLIGSKPNRDASIFRFDRTIQG
jgi:glycine/D-amino acid oxidase-like deaminating enzyme